MISYRFIEGRHSFCSFGKRQPSKSRPSANDGLLNFVLAIRMGGWKGNLSLSKMSKLKVSVFYSIDKAVP